MIIFEDIIGHRASIALQALESWRRYHKTKVEAEHRVRPPPIIHTNLLIGFFDGSSQFDGEIFGASVLLRVDVNNLFRLRIGCRSGTNTRSELLGLAMLLLFANTK